MVNTSLSPITPKTWTQIYQTYLLLLLVSNKSNILQTRTYGSSVGCRNIFFSADYNGKLEGTLTNLLHLTQYSAGLLRILQIV